MHLYNNQKELGNDTFCPQPPAKRPGVVKGLRSKRGVCEKLRVCLLRGKHSAYIKKKGRIWIYGMLNVNTI